MKDHLPKWLIWFVIVTGDSANMSLTPLMLHQIFPVEAQPASSLQVATLHGDWTNVLALSPHMHHVPPELFSCSQGSAKDNSDLVPSAVQAPGHAVATAG